ncbi:MAG TPA: 5'-nucleotidase [Armatimonadota bacterium]|jgi:2',3'-cyclic-nucleotide 2'-phosphodiesterase/3'-nucleotidase/5'-nucleotidase
MKHATTCIIAGALALMSSATRVDAQALGTSTSVITGTGARAAETSAGNLIADALKAAVRADAALVPADAVAPATIAKGPISRDALKSVLQDPDDEVAVISLTGAQLRVALERSVSMHPKPFDGLLQVSGIYVEFDSGRSPGPRLLKVTVNGAALDANRKYRIAAPYTLASGGLGYYRMWPDKEIVRTGKSVLDGLAAYVAAQHTVSPRVEGRLVGK